ncbi:MAG: tetratricopeptide repeat protein [Pseudomonadota bacterium]
MIEHHLRNGFTLNDHTVFPLEGRIEAPSGSVHVQPKVMEVLVFLARNPGAVVSRDQIVDSVWHGSVVTDEALTRCISELRSTFKDPKKAPKFIQTIPKRGYRLVASVAALLPDEAKTPVMPDIPEDTQQLSFWQELNRRHVMRVAVAYLAIAWAILGGADLFADILDLPDNTLRYVLLALIIGFPIVTLLAWTLQVTDQGVVVDMPGLKETGQTNAIRRKRLNIVILVSAVLACGLWFFQQDSVAPASVNSPPTQGEKPSVAVLRFKTIGDDPTAKRLGDGLGVEISNQLYETRLVRVPAREWVWSLSDDPQSAATKLAVDHVVSGIVAVEGDRVQASVQLVKSNSEVVWNQTFNKQFSSFFELQSEIAEIVLTELKVTLAAEAAAKKPQSVTFDADAYLQYLEGTYFLREPATIGTLNRARESFENALRLDVNFAGAYAGLCDTYIVMYSLDKTPELMSNAEQTCNAAADLSPDSDHVLIALSRLYRNLGQYQDAKEQIDLAREIRPDSYEAKLESGAVYQDLQRTDDAVRWLELAKRQEPFYYKAYKQLGIFYSVNGQLENAETEFARVTELSPNDPYALSDLGGVQLALGKFNAAKNSYEQSLEIGPTRNAYSNLATIYFYMNNYRAAEDYYQRSVDIAPNDPIIRGNLADAQRYGESSERAFTTYRQAISLAESALEINPNNGPILADLAYYYSAVDDSAKAVEFIARAISLTPQDLYTHYRAALIYAHNGDTDRSLDALESAVSLGYDPALLRQDPGLATIVQEPRFEELLKQQ